MTASDRIRMWIIADELGRNAVAARRCRISLSICLKMLAFSSR